MKELFVELHNIRPGLIVGEDVFVNTNFPIVKKNTTLTVEHIEVLQIFNVKKIKVKKGIVTVPEELSNENTDPQKVLSIISIEKDSLKEKYIQKVQKFKREFISWKSGTAPDVASIRSVIVPLLEQYDRDGTKLSFLSEFSNPKDYFYRHSIAVGILSFAIGKNLGLPKGHLLQLGIAGALVDCGMAKINTSIEKPVLLTESELKEIKKHPVYSYQMVKDSSLLRTEMKLAILQHHERLDGSGYPRGDKQPDIPLYSQILAVADVYHAMTSERVYKSRELPFKVLELIKEEEFGKFHMNVIEALYNVVGNLSIGTEVRLSNGLRGFVIFIHRDTPYRPIIKLNDESTIDLIKQRDIVIEAIL